MLSCRYTVIFQYFIILLTIATISSLIRSDLLPACFSCSNNFNLSQSSSGLSGQNTVEMPKTMIAGDLSKFIGDPSLRFFRPTCLILNFISFPKS